MTDIQDDLRYAARLIRRNPGFAATAVAALALGIGANSAIFSVLNAVMFRPLPFPDPDRLAIVWETTRRAGAADPSAERRLRPAATTIKRWREQSRSFEELGGYSTWELTLTGTGEPERVVSGLASPSLFGVLREPPHLGRLFTEEEDQAGRDRVVILSYAFWQRRFASDPRIIGQSLRIDGEPTTVIGILPPEARIVLPGLSPDVEIWVPPTRSIMVGRRIPTLQVVGRLRPGVLLSQAQAEMETIAARLEKEFPETNLNRGVRLAPVAEEIAGRVRPALVMLLGSAGCVLLIACANVANLLVARTAARGRELGVRAVLGAGRARLTRQLLTESLLLAAAGGALGLLLSVWGTKLLLALSPRGLVPRAAEAGLDWRVGLFGLAVSLATGVLLGLIPASGACRLAARGDLAETLKATSAGSTGVLRGQRLRFALIAGEVALSVMLLAAAGLLIRSLIYLRAVDLGFRPENLLIATVTLPQSRYKEPAQRGLFAAQVLERLEPAPSVEGAAFVNSVPLARTMAFASSVEVEGRAAEREPPRVEVRAVTSGYFRALGMRLKAGRLLSDTDGTHNPVVVINEAMARRFWPPGSADPGPLGSRIRMYGGPHQIVGVVSDVRSASLRDDPVAEIYTPISENPLPTLTLVVRTPVEPMSLVGYVKAAVHTVDADIPLERVNTMERVVYSESAAPRFQMALVASFAAIALVLAAIGLYGVIGHSAGQRTREIGIRMALGAGRSNILAVVCAHGMGAATVGVALGVCGALAAGRLLATFLFGVKSTDAWTLAAVAILALVAAALASFVPARRATQLDPMAALRYE